jgi:purine-cytosine permease-like protein
VFALINYVAYNTSDALLSGDAMHTLFGINTGVGYSLAASFAAVIALYGFQPVRRHDDDDLDQGFHQAGHAHASDPGHGIVVMFVMVWTSAQFVGIDRFNTVYGNVLIFLAYLFTPWTAINLIDYFFVRRGLYSIKEIFRPDGIYGRWGRRGQLA